MTRHENGELLNSNKNISPHYGFKKFCTALFKGIRPEFPCHFGGRRDNKRLLAKAPGFGAPLLGKHLLAHQS